MPTMSALVETVSINYDDFNESFLTCATCLCMYDSSDHAPKLLPCSHTVCRSCIEHIILAVNESHSTADYDRVSDTGGNTFRCPICRETVRPPQGGVLALPPSFLVNQLLDLMARQRREIVPKCAVHMSQELLFCETCDVIFCVICQGSSHSGSHTAIPFSVAMKRVSEILLYKAHLCLHNLNLAQEAVQQEQRQLNVALASVESAILQSFDAVVSVIQQRREAVTAAVYAAVNDKRRVLDEQLEVIGAERRRVEEECQGLESQLEVRHITKRIVDLNERLDATSTLLEPRENAFVQYEWQEQLKELTDYVLNYGKVTVSTTFPLLCRLAVDEAVAHLECRAVLTTVDYHGQPRLTGGDPVCMQVFDANSQPVPCCQQDLLNGTYSLSFVPRSSGTHTLHTTIFDRHVKGSPYKVDVTSHINPVARVGCHGCGATEFNQPTAIACDDKGSIYVADTGNCRIKVLSSTDGSLCGHLMPEVGLEQQGCTGLAVTPTGTLMLVNWRTRQVTEIRRDGLVLNQFTAQCFVEPTALAVNSKGDVIVVDSAADSLFMFDRTGFLICSIRGSSENCLSTACGIAVAVNDEIVVAGGHLLQCFGADGKFKRTISGTMRPRGQYGGIAVDAHGNILVTRTEKGRGFIDVFMSDMNGACFVIDSSTDKLRRPTDLVTTSDHRVIVCDLGNNCIKTYRYK